MSDPGPARPQALSPAGRQRHDPSIRLLERPLAQARHDDLVGRLERVVGQLAGRDPFVALGWLLGQRGLFPIRTATRAMVLALGPCMVFSGVVHLAAPPGGLVRVVAAMLVLAAATAAVTWVAARRMGAADSLPALLLSTLFMNAGYLGVSVNLLTFGEEGLRWASLWMALQSCLTNSLGISIAAGGHAAPRRALAAIITTPLSWALVLGFAIRAVGGLASSPVVRACDLVAVASIPPILALLGAQLATARPAGHLRLAICASGIRLIIAPILAAGTVVLLGIGGTEARVIVLQAAMPTAMVSSVLASYFDTEPALVTAATFVSMAAACITLPAVLALVLM